MKKTLLLTLAGIMVAGSAFALPAPGDRKAQCERHPDKFVWVEKNKTCIPINPCTSDDESIKKAYCLDVTFDVDAQLTYSPGVVDYLNVEPLKTIVVRYAEKVLGTKIVGDMPFMEAKYIGAKTSDGGYFVVKSKYSSARYDLINVSNAALAYGYKDVMVNMNTNNEINGYTILGVSKTECEDITDFATLIADTIVNYDYEKSNKKCVLTPTPRDDTADTPSAFPKDSAENTNAAINKFKNTATQQ